jgi:high affinity sulfate transporter 1
MTTTTAETRGGRLERWAPGFRAVRTYDGSNLPRDLIAAAVLVTLLVPQGMAYAELAGLPAITGLYTTVVCLVAFSLVGSSPVLILGPDSALGPMIAATILPLAAGSEEQAIALAGMLALLVGIITISAGVVRLGFVADLLSSPVRTGYLAGLAITILVGQLPKLFGFSTDASGLIAEAQAFLQTLDLTNPWALAIGVVSLAIILGLRWRSPRMPGILVAVVVSMVASTVLDLAGRGVDVIGVLPQGFPLPTLPAVPLEDVAILFASAVGITLVAVGDTISTSSAFATRGGYEVDTNQELVGIGSANVAAGLFTGFPVTTSSSRTAVAFQSGAKSQLTGLIAAVLVLAMLVFVPGLVQSMPQPVLAAIVIAASITLFDAAELRRLYGARKAEFGLAMASLLGVALVGVLQGIVVAVVLSVFYIFKRVWAPYSTVLGRAPGVAGWHDVRRYPDAEQIPGLVIVRWSAPLFFANANQFRDRVRAAVNATQPRPRWVLIAAEPINDVDTTAGAMLVDLDEELEAEGISLTFAEVQGDVRDWAARYALFDADDTGRSFRTVDEAVEAFLGGGDPTPAGAGGSASRDPPSQ